MVLGFCQIQHEFSAILNFPRCMNMHSIMGTPFDNHNHEILKAYEISDTKRKKGSF